MHWNGKRYVVEGGKRVGVDMTAGEKIKAARIAAGLTQRSMSAATGIPLQTICNWETGRREPVDYILNLVLKELKEIQRKKKRTQARTQVTSKLQNHTDTAIYKGGKFSKR